MNNENNVPGQKHASRVSRLAITSCCLALLPAPWVFFGLSFPVSLTVQRLLTLASLPLSVITGIYALVLIKYRSPKLRGKTLAIAGIAISIAYVVFVPLYAYRLNRLVFQPTREIKVCQSNMSRLYVSLENFAANHNGLLPAGPNWCDELLQENSELAVTFVCHGSDSKPGQNSYALNKDVVGQKLSDLPPDTVMLFETTAGWNQVGGPELLTTDNHSLSSTDYCNLVFASGQTQQFSIAEIYELHWKP